MRVEAFFEKFEVLAEAPGAVEKMRELVLQLAMRGKLVVQEPDDGDANGLLNTIAAARARIGRGTSDNDNDAVESSSVAGWYPIPTPWRWVRLSALGKVVGGGTPRSDNPAFFADEGVPWLTPADLNGNKEKRIFRGRRFITEQGLAASSARLLPAGSVLFSSRAPIGYVAIAGVELATNQGFKSCVPVVSETCEFLYYYLRSAAVRIDREASGTTFREVSGRIVSQIPIPLPPLAEQRRIVAKVDELMALCDQLEAQQREREERKTLVVRAALGRFGEAPTPANLQLVFHRSYDVAPAELRKAILTLAVQGKLVEQDPDDEDAATLIREIVIERTAEVKAGRIRPFKPPSPVRDDELWFSMRKGWKVVRLGEIVMEIQTGPFGTALHKSDYHAGGTPVINPASLKDGRIVPIDSMAVGPATLDRLHTFKLRAGDIVLARRGEMGRCSVVSATEAGWLLGTGSLALKMPTAFHAPYLALYIGAPAARAYLGGASVGTTMQNLNQAILTRMPIGVPPLAEQRRIVAKVDELMALVDALEAQLATARSTGAALLDAIQAELTAA